MGLREIVLRLVEETLESLLQRHGGDEQLDRRGPVCLNGALAILALPGFYEIALQVAKGIEERGHRSGMFRTKVDVVDFHADYFANGEPKVRLYKDHIGGHDVVILGSGPGTPELLVNITNAIAFASRRRARRITLVTSYFPLCKSDVENAREFAMPSIWVSAWQAVANITRLDRIICVDPHSKFVTAAGGGGLVTPINMTRRLLKKIIGEALEVNDKIVLVFTDSSSLKRFTEALLAIEKEFGRKFPIVFASAHRNDVGKELKNVSGDVAALEGALALQLDDETDSARTQLMIPGYLLEHGAKEIWAGVTHGVLSTGAPDRFNAKDCLIDRLYIIDTIVPENRPELEAIIKSGRLRVLSWVEDLVWVLYNLHWDEDIRDMR